MCIRDSVSVAQRAQFAPDLVLTPDKEAPFLAFRIGVGCRIEAPRGVCHLAQDVVAGLPCHAGEVRAAGDLKRLGVGDDEQCVVVQHLFEMRYQPPCVGRVAMKATAKLIVETTSGHLFQREGRHVQRFGVCLSLVMAQKQARRDV